jgi:hypothetical protein
MPHVWTAGPSVEAPTRAASAPCSSLPLPSARFSAPQEAQAACDADPNCQAIIHAPKGLPQLGFSGELSIFKVIVGAIQLMHFLETLLR